MSNIDSELFVVETLMPDCRFIKIEVARNEKNGSVKVDVIRSLAPTST